MLPAKHDIQSAYRCPSLVIGLMGSNIFCGEYVRPYNKNYVGMKSVASTSYKWEIKKVNGTEDVYTVSTGDDMYWYDSPSETYLTIWSTAISKWKFIKLHKADETPR